MNKQTKHKIVAALQRPVVQRAGIFAAAFLVIGTVTYFGSTVRRESEAAPPVGSNAIYISPETGSYLTGETFQATVRAVTATDPINAVQTAVSYDPAKLQFVSITEGTAFPTVAATDTATAGLIRLARARQIDGITGDNVVVTLTFRMLAASGSTAGLTVDPNASYLVRSTDNVNILNFSAGSSYTVRFPAPAVSTVSPNSGPMSGGTVVTINGSNFQSGATVRIGTTNATGVTFVSSTQLRATTPSHSAGGAKEVVVTNPDGQSGTLAGAFTYITPPTVGSVSPASGQSSGGTTITITGTNFAAGAIVFVGGTPASGVTVVSGTSIRAITPAHAAGVVDVVVRNADGQQGLKSGAFTYLNPSPVVSAISPNGGFVAGGLNVTITGANFQSGATVMFGSVAASSVVVVNASTITARTPSNAVGAVPVVVANPDGQNGSLPSAFTYRMAGDASGDGRVNAIDISTVITRDGQNYPAADFNGDGTVGAADMAILLAAWTW